mmetsp:Transcript_58896/g.124925  ORF Transcript_58896/g.124925 Transcript_58896/m.124925 type:complete len:403 (-) Transcript_58896:169-1377(-)
MVERRWPYRLPSWFLSDSTVSIPRTTPANTRGHCTGSIGPDSIAWTCQVVQNDVHHHLHTCSTTSCNHAFELCSSARSGVKQEGHRLIFRMPGAINYVVSHRCNLDRIEPVGPYPSFTLTRYVDEIPLPEFDEHWISPNHAVLASCIFLIIALSAVDLHVGCADGRGQQSIPCATIPELTPSGSENEGVDTQRPHLSMTRLLSTGFLSIVVQFVLFASHVCFLLTTGAGNCLEGGDIAAANGLQASRNIACLPATAEGDLADRNMSLRGTHLQGHSAIVVFQCRIQCKAEALGGEQSHLELHNVSLLHTWYGVKWCSTIRRKTQLRSRLCRASLYTELVAAKGSVGRRQMKLLINRHIVHVDAIAELIYCHVESCWPEGELCSICLPRVGRPSSLCITSRKG